MNCSWAVALVIIKFDEKHGQVVQSMFPKNSIPGEMMEDLKMLSMPDCLEAGSNHEFQYMVRIRDKRSHANGHSFLNCYVLFHQSKDSTTSRGYFQQSVVLVSKLTFVSLYFGIVERLSGALKDIPEFDELMRSSSLEEDDGSIHLESKVSTEKSNSLIDATLEVAFQHFLQWKIPFPGRELRLPFYGNIFVFNVPKVPPYYHCNDSMDLPKLNLDQHLRLAQPTESEGLFSSINLAAVFGRLGLLPHLWTLWELMASGQDIIVWSPCAAVCSSVVTALVSLLAPLAFSGDYRPYISPYDSDIQLFAASSQRRFDLQHRPTCLPSSTSIGITRKKSFTMQLGGKKTSDRSSGGNSSSNCGGGSGNGANNEKGGGMTDVRTLYARSVIASDSLDRPVPMVIGVTNPFLLRSFPHMQAAIFLPNPEAQKVKITRKQSNAASNTTTSSATVMSSSWFSSLAISPVGTVTGLLLGGSSNQTRRRSISIDTSKTRSMFCPLRIEVGRAAVEQSDQIQEQDSLSSNKKKKRSALDHDFCEAAYAVTLNNIGSTATIESAYDDWLAAGGSNRKTWSGMLCVRGHLPNVHCDKTVLKQFQSLSRQVSSNKAPTKTLGDSDSSEDHRSLALSPDMSPEETESLFRSERSEMGSQLLRDHFRQLTISLMRPFDNFFAVFASDCLSSSRNSRNSTLVQLGTQVLNGGLLTVMSPTDSVSSPSAIVPFSGSLRMGASSLTVYSDPMKFLGKVSVVEAVEAFGALLTSSSVSKELLPRCIRKSEWRTQLMETFGRSDSFSCYTRWRRELESLRLLHVCSQSCLGLTSSELLAAFAVEQCLPGGRADALSVNHFEILLTRISNTILALRELEERFGFSCVADETQSASSTAAAAALPVASNNELLQAMEAHYEEVSEIFHKKFSDSSMVL